RIRNRDPVITSVSELAKIMNVPASEIISKFFMMGQLVTMNQRLDKDSLEMICDEFKVDFRFEDEYGTDIIEQDLSSMPTWKMFRVHPL
ncbi:MAG: translation initiation factor IF-2 N-terminal domain-containing protein, partial [Candidatus Cloacimonetes bacterium]|nr:translation initiation factor IF-2 N-terminal domain-containing protein [Candidatus Cloacimonadota bacterium]